VNTERARDVEPRLRQVVETLEEEIVLGVLHPRERLVEDELLGRFQLKRHVVRQVLGELERMGLVERKRNVGAVVKAYGIDEVRNLYAVRELLETHCVAMIRFPLPEGRLDALIDVQRCHDTAVQAGDLRGAFRANITFHRTLFGLSDNPVLVEAIQDHAQRAHSIRTSTLVLPEQLERARQEHWQIIDALRNADSQQLIELCRGHLSPSRDAYIEAFNRRAASHPGIASRAG